MDNDFSNENFFLTYREIPMKKWVCYVVICASILGTLAVVDLINSRFSADSNISSKGSSLQAGFARVKITPPVGTPMTGFGDRDWDPKGSRGVHDDIYARALYLSQGGHQVLIMGFDLLFFSRDEADRFKGAIGRRLDLSPVNILFNTSHTHTGPKVGTWFYTPSDPFYLNQLESAIVEAAVNAHDSAREAEIFAGSGTSELPMSRRFKDEKGGIAFQPNPSGTVCSTLPVSFIKDKSGKPICLLFSTSCHPSTVKGNERSYQISADYPGAAMAKLDSWLGAPASLFLQGAGGDAKASIIGKGEKEWRAGTWDDVEKAGTMVADEVKAIAGKNMVKIKPDILTSMIIMNWPLAPSVGKSGYEQIIRNPKTNSESSPEIMKLWAKEQLGYLERGYTLPTSVQITLHGLKLSRGLRLVGIEGEAVAELGLIIKNFYRDGVTFPLGYTDGAQMYLPTSNMLDEGGYEVESYWEYRQPSPLAKGMEKILADSMSQLQNRGIE
jgi:neutral ceramidase